MPSTTQSQMCVVPVKDPFRHAIYLATFKQTSGGAASTAARRALQEARKACKSLSERCTSV